MEDCTALELNASAVSREHTIFFIPNQSAVLIIIPRLPGSLILSSASVRPENIAVETEQPQMDGWNIISGEIETITFHGAITRLAVNASGQRIVADITIANTKPVSLNQKIWLKFPPEACQVMAAEE